MGEQGVVLKHHRRAPLGRRGGGDVVPADKNVAVRRRLMARDQTQRRRLAAPGWPK